MIRPNVKMAKTRTIFICRNCSAESPKWVGHCSYCNEWNSYEEKELSASTASSGRSAPAVSQELAEIALDQSPRLPLTFAEFNRVLGGGIVPGSLILIGGDPGIGKSTLLLQAAAALAQKEDRKVLYVSGEESASQIKLRAERLGLAGTNLFVLPEIRMEAVLDHARETAPDLAVIDSIQTVYLEGAGAAGSVSQVRECTLQLMEWAKSTSIPVFLVGHVTKEGAIAGPRVLEHIVDVVLYLEGERFSAYRILRGVKNRFGSTNEIGIFEMRDKGLIEVDNPSKALISQRTDGAIGSVIVPTLEGTRPLLAEIQALTNPTSFGTPRRTANGIDFNRLLLVAAVLSRRGRIPLSNQDIIANVTGGLKINEPAADLGMALAIASSFKNVKVNQQMVAIGEVGLSGELRPVSQLERRVTEAAKMGFKSCLIPAVTASDFSPPKGIELLPANTLAEAIKSVLG